jgi:hypothetical protein
MRRRFGWRQRSSAGGWEEMINWLGLDVRKSVKYNLYDNVDNWIPIKHYI